MPPTWNDGMMEWWNVGIMARPGLQLVAYASESATHVSIAASGELDYQPIFRRISSQLGLGQGIMVKNA